MDLRMLAGGLFPKCCFCNLSVYEVIRHGTSNICILCSVIRKCIRCSIPINGDLTQDFCSACLPKASIVSCIIPNELYLSDYYTSRNYSLLQTYGIKQILTIGKELPQHQTNDFSKVYISLDDAPHEKISDHFHTAHEFIYKAPTLVHCYAGISRSATLVISYLMKHKGMSLNAAIQHCRKVRPIVNPNHGFIDQLSKFERLLYGPVLSEPDSPNLSTTAQYMYDENKCTGSIDSGAEDDLDDLSDEIFTMELHDPMTESTILNPLGNKENFEKESFELL